MSDNNQQQANTVKRYQVKRDELPLSCPLDSMALWNSHPKVFLDVEQTGEAACPYCGTVYELVDK